MEFKPINRTNDYAFKRILGSEEGKDALISFLNAVLKPPPGQELHDVELLDGSWTPGTCWTKRPGWTYWPGQPQERW
ncbi:MAG: PD-(D/E)XK nuclease family transposase [Bacillota bacterium]